MLPKLMLHSFQLLALDIHGVITDGSAPLPADGSEEKRFSFHDLDAVNRVRRAGLQVVFITGEEGAVVEQIAHRFGLKEVTCGARDTLAALTALSQRTGLPVAQLIYGSADDR